MYVVFFIEFYLGFVFFSFADTAEIIRSYWMPIYSANAVDFEFSFNRLFVSEYGFCGKFDRHNGERGLTLRWDKRMNGVVAWVAQDKHRYARNGREKKRS